MIKLIVKVILIVLIGLGILYFTGFFDNSIIPDNLASFKGLEEIPVECSEFQNDVCGLYGCMVSLCWCTEILEEGNNVLDNKEDVEKVVQDYFLEKGLNYEIVKTVAVNEIYYNVFCDFEGNEIVYTVAIDGSILKTSCGV